MKDIFLLAVMVSDNQTLVLLNLLLYQHFSIYLQDQEAAFWPHFSPSFISFLPQFYTKNMNKVLKRKNFLENITFVINLFITKIRSSHKLMV